jgi:hypothetical protein
MSSFVKTKVSKPALILALEDGKIEEFNKIRKERKRICAASFPWGRALEKPRGADLREADLTETKLVNANSTSKSK